MGSYRNNNNVYVLIPKGDWNETKTITGKKDNKNQKEVALKLQELLMFLANMEDLMLFLSIVFIL